MQIPIPDDWSLGDDWECIQLQFPKSTDWLIILQGLITMLARGRLWDRETGSILGVQEIAREIENRNLPLITCDGVPVENIINQMGGLVLLEDDNMGQVVTEVWIDTETGELVVEYGPCCVHRFDIGSAISDQPPTPDDDDTEPQDPPPADISCRKAYWMGSQLAAVMESAWNLFPDTIWEWSEAFRDAHRRLNMSTWSVYKIYQEVSAIWTAGVVFQSVWSPLDTEVLICLWEPQLSNVDYSLTRTEYDAMKSAKGNLSNPFMQAVLNTVFDALNFSNFQLLAAESRDIEDAVCDCPGDYIEDTGPVTWENSRVLGLNGAFLREVTQISPKIMRFKVYGNLSDNFQECQWEELLAASGTVEEIEIRHEVTGLFASHLPTDAWVEFLPVYPASYFTPTISISAGRTEYHSAEPGIRRTVTIYNPANNLDAGNVEFACKLNPKDQNPTRTTYEWTSTIVYSGARRT